MVLKVNRLRTAWTICLAGASLLFVSSCDKAPERSAVPAYGYRVVGAYPHDQSAWTQGLAYEAGFLYEGTGLFGRSTLRKTGLTGGQTVQMLELAEEHFGEGVTVFGDHIAQLTWRSHLGFVYDKESFRLLRAFDWPREGWGMTYDGENLIVSDGTSILYFLDPQMFTVVRTVTVTADGEPLDRLNELEFVRGRIYANIWETDRIAIIDPADGRVAAFADLAGLLNPDDYGPETDVLNGIAYDAAGDRLFVTGKCWPKVFEIRIVER